ncbi:MAG: 23S rRNA (adenine(2503)-C(2))-methyltransferase RlmN [Terriglobales bacterium]
MDRPKIDILGLSIQELSALVEGLGQPAYRAKQLYRAIYRERQPSLQAISTIPETLKAQMEARGFVISQPTVDKKFVSVDGTVRYLLGYPDGQSVETVWMPEGDGGEAGDGSPAGDEEAPIRGKPVRSRATICVSSQVGCAVNCQFCMTALLGLKRNLTAGEIVGQVMVVLNDHKVDVTKKRINLVFMGQGEPFHNYDNFIKAVRLLVEGVGLPETRMTVSTSGIVPRIADLGKETIRPKLAISLNASNDAERTRLIPINKKWNIAALLEAAKHFPLRRREKVTFEYVLLDHENDSLENAHEVVELLRDVPAKVNLIAWNSGPEIDFATPSDERVLAFQKILRAADIPTYIRRPRGRDIYAACGQLKRTAS